MKKYFLMIPLMLFPYAYLIFFAYYSMTPYFVRDLLDAQSTGNLLIVIIGLYLIYILFITFYNTIASARGKYTAYQSAKINLIVKGVQIPAYIFHFILGMMGTVMSVWGIGIIIVAVVVDLVTILLTGISSIGCSVRLKKEKILNIPAAILMGIGCFIYVVDVGVAVTYFFIARKRYKKAAIPKAAAEVIG